MTHDVSFLDFKNAKKSTSNWSGYESASSSIIIIVVTVVVVDDDVVVVIVVVVVVTSSRRCYCYILGLQESTQ